MRLEHKVEQNSEEWLKMREGLFTSSPISDLFKDPRSKADKEAGKLSASANTLVELKALELAGQRQPFVTSYAMEWGHEYEPFAAEAYQEIFKVDVSEGNFWTFGANNGSSPDRKVNKNGLLEIKCPKSQSEHLLNLRFVKDAESLKKYRKPYYFQIQHQLYVTGKEWCDFLSFDPRLFSNESTIKAGFVCVRILPNLDVFKEFEVRVKAASELRDKIFKDIVEYDF